MPILSISDFAGFIPNTDKDEVVDELTRLIAEKEPEFLIKAIGYGLHKQMTDTPSDQKWVDLIDGAEFTWLSSLNKWNGLKVPIRNYVLFYWHRKNATQTTGIGEMIPSAENATRTSPEQKQITAWNEMAKQLRIMYSFIYVNLDNYGFVSQSVELTHTLNPYGI